MANLTAKESYDIAIENKLTVPKEDMDWIQQRAKDGYFDAMIDPGFGQKRERVASILRNLGYEVENYDTTRLMVSWINPRPEKRFDK